MKIYLLSVFTSVSDYCGLGCSSIVSKHGAIEDYVSSVKERILVILSKKPYLRQYPVFISVSTQCNNSDGVFKSVSSYTIELKINYDNSFHRSITVH